MDQIITFENDTWRIIGRGATNELGEVFCHLSSTTRFSTQRNGKVPVQIATFVPAALLQRGEG